MSVDAISAKNNVLVVFLFAPSPLSHAFANVFVPFSPLNVLHVRYISDEVVANADVYKLLIIQYIFAECACFVIPSANFISLCGIVIESYDTLLLYM